MFMLLPNFPSLLQIKSGNKGWKLVDRVWRTPTSSPTKLLNPELMEANPEFIRTWWLIMVLYLNPKYIHTKYIPSHLKKEPCIGIQNVKIHNGQYRQTWRETIQNV